MDFAHGFSQLMPEVCIPELDLFINKKASFIYHGQDRVPTEATEEVVPENLENKFRQLASSLEFKDVAQGELREHFKEFLNTDTSGISRDCDNIDEDF